MCIVVFNTTFFLFRFVRFLTFRRVLDAEMGKYSLILCKMSLSIFMLVVYITLTGEWHTVFHWLSKHMHVMWYHLVVGC